MDNGLVTATNLLLNGSTTLQNFTALYATTTNATTTSFAVTGTATTTFSGNGINISDGCFAIDNVCVSGGGGGGTITGSGVSGQVTYWNGTSAITGESAFSWDATGKKLGIGTSTPWAKLSVEAKAGNTGPLFLVSTSTLTATSTAFIVTETGLVGIGTSSPYAALSVEGQVVASYFTATSTTATSSFAHDISTTGRLKVIETGTLATIIGDTSGSARGTSALDVQSTRTATSQVASGANSAAVGSSNTAGGSFSSAFGISNSASASGSSASGYTNTASAASSSALGYTNTASAIFGSAFGYTNTASATSSSAFGSLNTASATSSSAFGYTNTASGAYSSTFGILNIANAASSSAFGSLNTASGVQSSAFGSLNTASGYSSSAFGYSNSASGASSTASGYVNTASADYSTASGYKNTASALNSSVFGLKNFSGTGGLASIVVGVLNNQTGGVLNYLTSNISGTAAAATTVGRLTTTIGILNTAGGNYGVVVGLNNTISANMASSSAFGMYNTVSVGGASAFGQGISNDTATSTMIGPTDAAKLTILGATGSVGYVGIGTTTPGAQLNVIGALCVDDATPTCANAARTAGTIYSVAVLSNTLDLAESYPTKDLTLGPGEIVTLDTLNPVFVNRASKTNTTPVIGIVSTAPGFYLGGFNSDLFANEKKLPIALSGRVPLKVNNENGPIEIGDRIALSHTSGVGMKAKASGDTVGIALESMLTTTGTIDVFVNLNSHTSPTELTIAPSGNVGIGTTSPLYKLDVSGDTRALSFAAQASRSSITNITHLKNEDYQAYLEKIRSINISTFRYNLDTPAITRLGLIADEAPSEVLTATGDVDVYKLTTFTLAGLKAEQLKVDSLEQRIAVLEAHINQTSGTGGGLSMQTILTNLESLGTKIVQGIAYMKEIVTDKLTVGSPEKPTGITLYPKNNSGPYCVKISNGQLRTEPGKCPTPNP